MKPIHERPQFIPMVWSISIHAVVVAVAFFIHFSEPQAAEDMLHFNVKSVDTHPLLLKYTSPATNPASKSPSRRFSRPAGENNGPKDVSVDTLVKPETVRPKEAPEIEPKQMELEKTNDKNAPKMGSLLTDTEQRSSPDVIQVKRQSTSGENDLQKMMEKHKADVGQFVQSMTKSLQNLGFGAQRGHCRQDPSQ